MPIIIISFFVMYKNISDSEAMHTTPRFVKDTSKYWYKPSISREEGTSPYWLHCGLNIYVRLVFNEEKNDGKLL